jgi:hypothetical protein
VITAKITNASGAKYSVHKEAPRQYVPIAPVGSSYTPVGKIDITQMRQGTPRDVPQPSTSAYTPARSELGNIRTPSTAAPPTAPRPVPSRPPVSAPAPAAHDWEAPSSERIQSVAPPIPTTSRPSATVTPSSGYRPPTTAAVPPTSNATTKVDRIGPNQPAYQPVQLAAPKKLVNPFAARQAEATLEGTSQGRPGTGVKALTWSERQAIAKKRQEEEDQRSKTAIAGAATVGAGASILAASAGSTAAPPPPPTPPALTRVAPEPEPELESAYEEEQFDASSPPPPPPPPVS